MSNLLIDLSKLNSFHKENHTVKIRVLGTVLDYDPMNQYMTIKSINVLSQDSSMIKLSLDLIQLTNAEFSDVGTLIDANCIYDGEKITIYSIRLLDHQDFINYIDVLKQVSNLKQDEL